MKILVPVDGSEPALDAVRHALRLRRAGLQASFVLATVQEPTFLYEMILAPDAEVLERVTGAVGSRALEGAQSRSGRPAFPSSARLARATRRPR
jgi:nucleotide-binding universal stress UspA family protein